MKRTLFLSMAASAFWVCVAPVGAETTPATSADSPAVATEKADDAAKHPHRMGKDGVLERAQFDKMQTALFKRMDADGDGILTRLSTPETTAPAGESADAAEKADKKAPHRGREHMDALLAKADVNQDGKITLEEFLAAGDAKFKEMDKNGDGKITADERPDVQKRGWK